MSLLHPKCSKWGCSALLSRSVKEAPTKSHTFLPACQLCILPNRPAVCLTMCAKGEGEKQVSLIGDLF
uniref:Uncharacterized protein n=1 Tax=Mola mola TaxID=94237 RepID=A0A3Q4AAJ8_MOLML